MNENTPRASKPAAVFSGGGARGAYEVGVVRGVVDVLGLSADDPAPFSIFSGTSVGAINAAYLAANTHRGDLGIGDLQHLWTSLSLPRHLRIDPMGVLALPDRPSWASLRRRQPPAPAGRRRSVLDSRPFEKLIGSHIRWERLHANVACGRTEALFITAMRVANGRTTVFAEMHPGLQQDILAGDPRRPALVGQITHAHVLASAALPLIFPARAIDGRFYCDGGLRFSTPIGPAVRAGADRLMVITLLAESQEHEEAAPEQPERYPGLLYLAGKLLNSLLNDPIVRDLDILERFNALVEALQRSLSPEEIARLHDELMRTRGMPYRMLRTLVFRPSVDIGQLAFEHIRDQLPRWNLNGISAWALRRVAKAESRWEADLASYMLFDGGFADRLMQLGRNDAHAKADEVRAFFA